MNKKKLVCRGLGSDKWVEVDHLTTPVQNVMIAMFGMSITNAADEPIEGITRPWSTWHDVATLVKWVMLQPWNPHIGVTRHTDSSWVRCNNCPL